MEVRMFRNYKALAIFSGFLVMLLSTAALGSSFKAVGNYAVGNHPVAIAAGDFNGDGKLDLAIANRDSKTVSVLLGNGDGTFAKSADFSVGIVPRSLTTADFYSDGRTDIVVADESGTKLSLLAGKGDGGFESHIEMDARQASLELRNRLQPQPSAASGTQSSSVVFADFNGDGQLDQAVSMSGRNMISVLLNVTRENAGTIDLIRNGGFESGALSPWFWGRKQYCDPKPCVEWAVTTVDPLKGNYDAWDTGNLELRQNFHATATSSISSAKIWIRHPQGAINAAIDFFYTSGADDEILLYTSDSDWDSFDLTADLSSGLSLDGLSVWGYSTGAGSVTYVDGVSIIAGD
jgi:FG-GAP-like repeat